MSDWQQVKPWRLSDIRQEANRAMVGSHYATPQAIAFFRDGLDEPLAIPQQLWQNETLQLIYDPTLKEALLPSPDGDVNKWRWTDASSAADAVERFLGVNGKTEQEPARHRRNPYSKPHVGMWIGKGGIREGGLSFITDPSKTPPAAQTVYLTCSDMMILVCKRQHLEVATLYLFTDRLPVTSSSDGSHVHEPKESNEW